LGSEIIFFEDKCVLDFLVLVANESK